ncbi:hypothetical protein CR513_17272, partial [Mucuna pruriens]
MHPFFLLFLEIHNRLTLYRTHFIDIIALVIQLLSTSVGYSRIQVILFLNVTQESKLFYFKMSNGQIRTFSF